MIKFSEKDVLPMIGFERDSLHIKLNFLFDAFVWVSFKTLLAVKYFFVASG